MADMLRTAGHQAVTAVQLDMQYAHDDEHLLHAAQHGRILVTHNWKDYRLLHHAWHRWSTAWGIPQQHPGILVLPHGAVPQFAQAILDLLATGMQIHDTLHLWKGGGRWERAAEPYYR
ncbi:MAG: DUF5615 family PIN-like protein [Chloroflexi bacterium]|nr:DUF5615 family PIN-like protein [Chloroflexota bacterium]